MKKILSFALMFLLIIGFISCDSSQNDETNSTSETSSENITSTTTITETTTLTTTTQTVTNSLATIDPTASITIHFLNNEVTNWNNPTLYYWGNGVSIEWPGIIMTQDNNSNWYNITIDGVNELNFLFSTEDQSGQTVDLYRNTEGWFVPTGSDESGKIIGTWYDSLPNIEPEKVSSEEVDLRRQQVLAYITNLSYGNATDYQGTISGQNCYHGDQILDTSYTKGFKSMVSNLHSETGEWVGMIGLDYEYDQIFTPEQLSAANEYLIDYANNGGLITINFSPQNPWVNDETDILNNPGTSTGNSSPQSDYSLNAVTSLYDLIDNTKSVNETWMRKLDRIADALEELRDAGVIVLWRPMQEMNGNWMWWGMSSHPDDPQAYIAVYQHMYNYFTNTRELNNLIWVYSPNSSYGFQDVKNNTSSWNRSVSWAYPGDDFVDIVAGTEYGNDVIVHDYEEYVSLGKPIGLAELGPGSTSGNFQMDNQTVIDKISNYYPRIAYWVSWHWNWAIINQNNATELLTDSRVINRGDFDTTTETGDTIDNPTAISKTLTVHILNNDITNWDNLYLYYWNEVGGVIVNNGWPGFSMNKEGNTNWYTITLEGLNESNIIFTTSSSSGQTVDLFRSSEGWFIPTGIDSETGKIIGEWYDTKPQT